MHAWYAVMKWHFFSVVSFPKTYNPSNYEKKKSDKFQRKPKIK